MSKRSVTIVGGGQSGLQLALGLQQNDYEVRIVQNRTPEEIRTGRPLSTQVMFDQALAHERALGINFWETDCPTIDSINISVPREEVPPTKSFEWYGELDKYAQSVDQRLKIPRWMSEFEARGGTVEMKECGVQDLERYAREDELVIVSSGKGPICGIFERDARRSPYKGPQRVVAAAYIKGMLPDLNHSGVRFVVIPGIGEYFAIPALTMSGPCQIIGIQGVLGGPLDCWLDIASPEQHVTRVKWVLDTFLPWEAERCPDIQLADANGVMSGSVSPIVRKPVARLPSGRAVLGMADVVVLNDPLTGQGSNNASKCAHIYLDSIVRHGESQFDEKWMQSTFDSFWTIAQYATDWTNLLIGPTLPKHVIDLIAAAQRLPELANRIANGFNQPRDLFPWFMTPSDAEAYLKRLSNERPFLIN